jgi:hypothetical protein
MAVSNETIAAPASGRSASPSRALVERVCASEGFRKAPRMQELLSYLCDSALGDQPPRSEHDIGVDVFGRPLDYDTSVETIGRVQVSHLRKRLELYFLSEGRDEPVVIDLPKGSYTPVFRNRGRVDGAPSTATTAAAPPARPSRTTIVLGGALVAALLLCAWLALDRARLARSVGAEATPQLDRFWGQFFESRAPVPIVMADVGVTMLASALGRSVTLSEYRNAGYPRQLLERLTISKETSGLVSHAAVKGFNTPNDTRVAHEIGVIARRFGSRPLLVSARDFQTDLHDVGNVVLLGNPRSNPWMELLASGLGYEFRYDEPASTAMIVRRASGPDPETSHVVHWGRDSYCLVACIPIPGGRGGNALLVMGAEFLSTEAGGHLVTDERAMADLLSRLGVAPGTRIPPFEVLLKTKLLGNRIGGYETVEHGVMP